MSDRKEFRDLAPPEDAHDAIASLELGGGTETVPLREARGRVLAERIDATLDVPGFDRASMDGYAVRARDTFGADEADPARLELVGEVHAGAEPDVTVTEGTAAEISTGAVMPPGADSVVMVEKTDRVERNSTERANGEAVSGADDGETVLVRTSLAPGDSVMLAGADVAAGERTLGPGTELTPREIGLLSALGVDEVPVRAKPRVGIISTGDELVRPGADLNSDAGQIYDVNSYTTATAVEEAGGEAVLYPHAGDDYEEMEDILTEAASECDLVLSSGSTSASAVDVIYRVIEERGELLLHGVAVKPGKPMLIGRLDGGDSPSAYVGLPGYPVSALTIFRTFVAPAIREAAGLPEPRTATVDGAMAVEERYAEGRRRLMPVGLVSAGPKGQRGGGGATAGGDEHGDTLVYPVDKGSGATTSLVEADGIVEVPAETEYLAAGEAVTVQSFSPDVRTPSLYAVGEDDPAFSRLLDGLDRPRYLSLGTREGLRRLRNGVPDAAVAAGDPEVAADHEDLGGWTRERGLLVPEGNPDDVGGVGDLVDEDLRLINRGTNSGLRTALDDAVAALAEDRDAARRELIDAIDGYELTVKAHESPARKVLAGDADAGLGLRATAEKLGLGFVPLGEQDVRVLANPDRTGKAGVQALRTAVENVDEVLADLPGYRSA
ncbi:molybdopterin biosynthesis protein [Halorientalis pallida]|uniref:Molybdopterin biosynthesis protein n=1 Tax=Halorientalis pallida TaxID=2479928 RepID=A0A498L0V5_9EURY|nr:molybdopterin biosynthesis protein [Halorientalis pallida]RXK51687.1 molybdopterin biosynthesis protein [Halorientalis pallida]